MLNISDLKFDERGLIPAIVVDADTKKVLTLAYMNEESLKITMERELTCFWSRSRQELWLKGETSGNFQHVVSITADCDRDALVVEVNKEGPACHLGNESCFADKLFISENNSSYTTYLFNKGIDKMLKKVGEEATEVIIAAKDNDKAETVYEIADLCYHIMVMMVELGISCGDILAELKSRHVIDHKVKQEKMKSDIK